MHTDDGTKIALALLAAGEAAHAFSSFLPSYMTIRSFALGGDEATIAKNLANLRSGYRPAILFGMGLAGVISYIARSPLPVLFAGGASAAMIQGYENALPPERRLPGGPLAVLQALAQPGAPATTTAAPTAMGR
jgi:hypothetical protein